MVSAFLLDLVLLIFPIAFLRLRRGRCGLRREVIINRLVLAQSCLEGLTASHRILLSTYVFVRFSSYNRVAAFFLNLVSAWLCNLPPIVRGAASVQFFVSVFAHR